MLKKIIALSIAAVVSGCATQDPAPVVSGFNNANQHTDNTPQTRYSLTRKKDVPVVTPTQKAATAQTTNPAAVVPSKVTTVEPAPQPKPKVVQPVPRQVTYRVQRGDTLSQVAAHYNVSENTLAMVNDITNKNALYVGQILIIPDRYEGMGIDSKASQAVARTHKVRRGETIYAISRDYGVSSFDIMASNNIDRPERLMPGTILRIPAPRGDTSVSKRLAKSQGLTWPARGEIFRRFGEEGRGITHTGISILLPEKAPVVAAADGVVIYADGGLRSYGNLILLRHPDGLVTAYAHNSANLVTKNQTVQRGQVIALAGRSGNVDKPQLHFEVRRNAQAVDPLKILPQND